MLNSFYVYVCIVTLVGLGLPPISAGVLTNMDVFRYIERPILTCYSIYRKTNFESIFDYIVSTFDIDTLVWL